MYVYLQDHHTIDEYIPLIDPLLADRMPISVCVTLERYLVPAACLSSFDVLPKSDLPIQLAQTIHRHWLLRLVAWIKR